MFTNHIILTLPEFITKFVAFTSKILEFFYFSTSIANILVPALQ